MNDAELIEGIQAGGSRQESCLNLLFDKHRGLVGTGITKYRLSEEDAIDAFSDAILALRKQIMEGKFRGDSKVSTYLYTIFSRRCVDRVRKAATNKVLTSPEYPDVGDPDPGIEKQLITQEAFEHLMGFMDQLGEVCRNILMYRYYYGYDDMAEIARLVGAKNANTAGSLRHRCMKQLLKIIGKG
ncbi:MAG: sigma-70 family RNA polymerase sigma factor [Bacteroidota bacterium]